MNVLVTGSSGCLGRLVTASLRSRGDATVWTSSRNESGDLHHVRCDLMDPEAIDRLVEATQPDLVFHLAGSYSGDHAVDLAINAGSARHLLDAARRRTLRPRTVLIGSAAEYGIVERGENPVSEARVLRPVSLYGVTKAYQTLLAGMYACQHDADVIVARLFNLKASGMSERLFVGRVERLIEQVRRGERDSIEVGSLSAERDYLDGAEAVGLLLLIADRGIAGEIYNVGSGRPVQMRNLLARMLADAGLGMGIVREESPTADRRGYDVPVIYADLSKTLRLRSSPSRVPG